MGLTADIKAEIAGTTVTASNARRSEVGAMIRFAGKLRLGDNNPGRSPESLVVSLDVDSSDVAERARQHIVDLYDIHAVVSDRTQSSKKPVFEVEWNRRGEGLDVARRLGLLDRAGRPVRGLPPRIVHGTAVDCEAAWRGAFLVRGSVTEPGRSSALEVIAPQTAAAIGRVRQVCPGTKAQTQNPKIWNSAPGGCQRSAADSSHAPAATRVPMKTIHQACPGSMDTSTPSSTEASSEANAATCMAARSP